MNASIRSATAAPLLLMSVLTLPACDSGTSPPSGLFDDFNPGEPAAAVDTLVGGLQGILSPVVAVRGAFPVMVDSGLTYDRAIARAVEFPPGVAGETFVYDDGQESWVTDSERTGAPANGARVIWYATDTGANILLPLEERGYADLTDEDDGSGSLIGIEMVATFTGSDIVIADLTERYDSATSNGTLTETFETVGFYGTAEPVNFDMTYAADTDTGTEDVDFTITVMMDGPSGLYDWQLSGTGSGTTTEANQTFVGEVTRDGVVTRVDLSLSVDDSNQQTGAGVLTHDGTEIANVTVAGGAFQYSAADGGELSSGQRSAVDNLIRTVYLGGFTALLRLPILFLGGL